MYIFLFANKKPPISTVTYFLDTHGIKNGLRRVRANQGGELAKSAIFRDCISKTGYTLEFIGARTSFQNGIVERPQRTLVDTMRTILPGSNLQSEYWSHTIRHAVYIKTILHHKLLPSYITPFQYHTKRRPNLTRIRIFGSIVMSSNPGYAA